ncbi:MAG: adenine phosphoribosyltransferase [Candidatus Poribacteria bacterium]|nr:adenine phosphoribosyltransferase [Candidatus Poribacteria bacterium]
MRDFASLVRNVPDFPKPGIQFKDITTLLHDGDAFRAVIDAFVVKLKPLDIETIVGIDARGFIFGGAIAYAMGCGFVPVRKRGKLPHRTVEVEYELEYGTDVVAIHEDALKNGKRVALVDDLIATGGTLHAATQLIEKIGGEIVVIGALIELKALNGADKFAKYETFALIQY